jgi:hypothetical protein
MLILDSTIQNVTEFHEIISKVDDPKFFPLPKNIFNSVGKKFTQQRISRFFEELHEHIRLLD